MQLPTEVPNPDNNTPLDMNNPFEIIVYIVIPIVLLVLYFFLRKKRYKNEEGDKSNQP
ncbi:MAG: adenylosuccinate synthetase [Bacteroidota bacterium]